MSEEQKLHYDTAKELESVIRVLMQPEDIVQQYLDAAKEMKLAGDYEDAKELEKTYRQKAETAKAEGKEKLYLNAKNRMEKAERDVELILAKQTFERVKGYKDADQLSEKCDTMIASMKQKSNVKHWVITVIVILAAVVMVYKVAWSSHEKELQNQQTEVSEVIDTDNESDQNTENV